MRASVLSNDYNKKELLIKMNYYYCQAVRRFHSKYKDRPAISEMPIKEVNRLVRQNNKALSDQKKKEIRLDLEKWREFNRKQTAAFENSAKQIIIQIAEAHDMTYGMLTGDRRGAGIYEARLKAIDAVYSKFPTWSLPALGRVFGGRDHSTMTHSLNKIKGLKLCGKWATT